MALAYYNDNGAYKPWTADMVGGLDKGISNLTYVRVLGSDNTEDWNTLSQGIYYIAGATLTEAKHCPMGGGLFLRCADNTGGECREFFAAVFCPQSG